MTVGELREKLDEWGDHLKVMVRVFDDHGNYVDHDIQDLEDNVSKAEVYITVQEV